MFYDISAIFKDIDLKFCTHIHETLPSNRFFENFDFEGENFEKEKKMLKILEIFRNFLRDSSFVALLILRPFI